MLRPLTPLLSPCSDPAATGVPAFRPPTDQTAFGKRLEDRLPSLLGAGFSSRTSRFIKNRLDTQRNKAHTKGRGRKGQWQHEDGDRATEQVKHCSPLVVHGCDASLGR